MPNSFEESLLGRHNRDIDMFVRRWRLGPSAILLAQLLKTLSAAIRSVWSRWAGGGRPWRWLLAGSFGSNKRVRARLWAHGAQGIRLAPGRSVRVFRWRGAHFGGCESNRLLRLMDGGEKSVLAQMRSAAGRIKRSRVSVWHHVLKSHRLREGADVRRQLSCTRCAP